MHSARNQISLPSGGHLLKLADKATARESVFSGGNAQVNLQAKDGYNMKRQLFRMLALISVCGTLICVLAGCVWSVGGKEHVSAPPTRGQELIDLKKARDQGAITPEEYEAKRKQILEH